jgi:hypothetical protein
MATRRIPFTAALAGLMALSIGSADAQMLGSAFTYQGRLTDAGGPANGLYDLQLCLYDVLAGASPLQCAPALDDVPVEGGLFTVSVDFGSVAFIGQQRFLELRVRPGTSTAGYTVLAPRQLLRATPEALRANVASAAPWAGLTGVPAGFADGIDQDSGGTVTTINAGAGLSGGPITTTGTLAIAAGGINASMIGTGQVGPAQIASSAIDSARIADESIAAADIGPNAVGASELADNAVDTAAIGNAQVNAAKIAPGAVGATQIDPTQVQARISARCAAGDYLRGINADGSVDCDLLPVTVDRVLDRSGDVGSHLALALRADQRPFLAYHDETNGNLKIHDCADAACTSGTRRTLDTTGDVGQSVAVAIGPTGLPFIAYRDATAQTLKAYACANAACTSGSVRTLDASVNVGNAVAMALRSDGRPLVAYVDFTAFRLRLYDCDNTACSSGVIRNTTGTSVPYGLSITMRADDRALIALGGNAGAAVRVRTYDCADIGCTTGTQRLISDVNYSPSVALVMRGNGRPLLVTAGDFSSLRVNDCADAVCTTTTQVAFDTDTTDTVGAALRPDGRPIVAFGKRNAPQDLRVLDCATTSCATGASRSMVAGGDLGSRLALALRDDGRPVIAHYDADSGDLRLHVCANSDCL